MCFICRFSRIYFLLCFTCCQKRLFCCCCGCPEVLLFLFSLLAVFGVVCLFILLCICFRDCDSTCSPYDRLIYIVVLASVKRKVHFAFNLVLFHFFYCCFVSFVVYISSVRDDSKDKNRHRQARHRHPSCSDTCFSIHHLSRLGHV